MVGCFWYIEVWYGGNTQWVWLVGPPNPPNMEGLGVTTLITSDNITAQTQRTVGCDQLAFLDMAVMCTRDLTCHQLYKLSTLKSSISGHHQLLLFAFFSVWHK